MIDFVEKVPIGSVTGSEYNPRAITDDALEKLQYSIRRFGMVKPLIVNASNNVITAGHQRKKAATAIGLEYLPCIRINSPNLQDEILFNLMHNSIETSKTNVRLDEFEVGGYHYCPSDKISIDSEPKNVLICSEITKLMSRYGEWGSVVTDGDGNVILNAEYAYCSKKLGYFVLSSFDQSCQKSNDTISQFRQITVPCDVIFFDAQYKILRRLSSLVNDGLFFVILRN